MGVSTLVSLVMLGRSEACILPCLLFIFSHMGISQGLAILDFFLQIWGVIPFISV